MTQQIKLRLSNGPLEDVITTAPADLQPGDVITMTDSISELQEHNYMISNRKTADGTYLCFYMLPTEL